MSGTIQQTVSFDEISYDIRRPQTIIEVAPNYSNLGLVGYPAKAILLGQMMAGAAGSPGVPYAIQRTGQPEALFGDASQLAEMCNAFRLANGFTPLFAMGALPPANSTAAQAALTMNGLPVVTAGTVPFYVAGRYVPLIVRTSDSLAQQAANLAAAINADTRMPVVASSNGAVATLTAKNAGDVGNALQVRIGLRGDELLPPGFLCGIGAFTGGAGAPDITPLLARLGSDWYTDLATGWTDANNLAVLCAELDRRYAAPSGLDMHAYAGRSLTLGEALLDGPTLNSRFLTRLPAGRSPSAPWAWAASATGVASFHLTNDPARQLKTLALPGILPPALADRYDGPGQEQLLRNGMSTFAALSDGTVTLQRVISCYQQSAAGVPDTAWLDIMAAKTMSRIRWDWEVRVALTFPRHKLCDDGSPAAQFSDAVVTPRRLWNLWAAAAKDYERAGWIEGAAATSQQSVFVRPDSDRDRVNARQLVNRIGNLMVLAARLEFLV